MVGLVLGKVEVGRGWSVEVEFGLRMARLRRQTGVICFALGIFSAGKGHLDLV